MVKTQRVAVGVIHLKVGSGENLPNIPETHRLIIAPARAASAPSQVGAGG